MMILQKIALVFTIIGAIVWGIYGLFDVNIVAKLFANVNMWLWVYVDLSTLVYSL